MKRWVLAGLVLCAVPLLFTLMRVRTDDQALNVKGWRE